VIGVDLHTQASSRSRRHQKYSVALLKDGKTVNRIERISKQGLIRLISRVRPEILAVDNIFELASTVEEFKSFVATLPGETSIVQVTGSPHDQASLQTLSKSYGLRPPSRNSPQEEAEAAAKLADLGVGSEVRVLERETKITISRSVSLGSGGQSQSRYRRSIHSSILRASRRISNALRKAGVDYDLFEEKSDFGLDRAEFTAYVSRPELKGIVRPRQGPYVRITIEPVFKKDIEFIPRVGARPSPLGKRPKKLIVGVDPGTTCGLAVLGFDSTPLLIDSRRGMTRGEIARTVIELGEPVIVASDVLDSPEFVDRLATSLNSIVFTPKAAMSAVEKQALVQEYAEEQGLTVKDSHARDALAAAIKAYRHHKNKFQQIELRLREINSDISVEEVKALVVRGISIQRAIELCTPPTPETRREPQQSSSGDLQYEERPEILDLKAEIDKYKSRLERLQQANEGLKVKMERMRIEVEDLKRALQEVTSRRAKEVRRERAYQVLRNEIANLRREIEKDEKIIQELQGRLSKLSEYRRLESKGDMILVKPIRAFTTNGLEEAFQVHNVKVGDLVMLLDAGGGGASTAEELVKRGVIAVIAMNEMSHQAEEALARHGIPVLKPEALSIDWVEGYPYVRASDVRRTIQSWRKRRRNTLTVSKTLESIVKEYRKRRIEELMGLQQREE